MLEATFDEATRVLVVKVTGKMSSDAINQALDDLQERYPQVGVRLTGGEHGGAGMLLDWENLEGWEPGAKVTGTIAGKMLSDVIRRCAVVAPEQWHGERERLSDIAKKGEVRFFNLHERDAAWTWLSKA